MRVAFDLDGVLRDLYGQYSASTGDVRGVWDCPICEFYDSDKHLLAHCDPTADAFFVAQEMVAQGMDVQVWHHARPGWEKYSLYWVDRYLPKARLIMLTPGGKVVRAKKTNTILFDDNPAIAMCENVVTVDRPWNQDVEARVRVKMVEEISRIVFVDKK